MSSDPKKSNKRKHSHVQSSTPTNATAKKAKMMSAGVIEPKLDELKEVLPKKVKAKGNAESTKRLVYDRLPRCDSNGLKNYLLFNVYNNSYHLTGTKGGNFKELAKQFADHKVQGLEKVSADSLQKKYEEIIEEVRTSIENGYISDLNGEASDAEDNSSDSEEDRGKAKRFNRTEPFERVAQLIISEVDALEELKLMDKKEREVRDNNLGVVETEVFDLIDTNSSSHNNGNSSSSSSSAAAKSKTTAPRKSPHDVHMEEFKAAIIAAAATPAPAPAHTAAQAPSLALASAPPTHSNVAAEVQRLTTVLSNKFVLTVDDVLNEADVSPGGKSAFYAATGMKAEKPAKKLILFLLDLAQDKNKTFVKHVMDTCGMNVSDSVELVDLLNTASE